ncbi:MAG: twin-arginine translocase TatA/TatE family subunit [Candidatus Rokuibacteriota bacterium]|nr:MAG: twin-arginine translocase TatA/TatE family subunit [Candidatus Rokubacteria bacterium]
MIGTQDLLIALALGAFFFGAKKLPELSRSLGRALVEFKKGLEEAPDQKPPAPASETSEAKKPEVK